MSGIGSHTKAYRGKNNEWLTPPHILKALGEFDLDPCAPVERPWPMARRHYTIEDDGTAQPWEGRVWCNPPYGPETWDWLSRLHEHGNGIALIFDRTETAGFVREVWGKADAMMFLFGRLHFYDIAGNRAKGNSGGPSVLVAYGEGNADALRDCGLPGALIVNESLARRMAA